jgi:peptidyl-prolyl cis-trans isomerase D
MLTTIRDRISGWIAYFVVLLISIPFALWGIETYFGGGNDLVAAEVNGVEIPMQAFTYQYQQQRQYLQQLYGGHLPSGQSDAAIKRTVLQGMVRAELLQQVVSNAGYRISDQALLDAIMKLDAFKTHGQFDPRRYEQILRLQGQTKASFEQDLRRQLAVSYFEDGITQSAFLPPSAEQELQRLKNQRRAFAYFVIPADPTSVNIGDGAIVRYFAAHRDSFQTPERVKLAYVELDEKDLLGKIQPSRAELHKYYQSEADRYATPELRKARQILLKLPEGADQKSIDKTRQRAEQLVVRLQAGADFAQLAQQYSEDKLSASSGGNLSFIARGDLNLEVEDVLFQLKKGEISDPIKTDLGFQIIQLVEIKPAKQKPFAAVRAAVERDFRQQKAQDRFLEQAERLETLTYEQSTSLEPAAKALGLDIKQTGWVTRQQGSGIASSPKIRAAAFGEDVLQSGHNSDVVELGPNRIVAVRVIAHEAARPKPLSEVRGDIKRLLAARAARERAVKTGQRALAKLRNGKPMHEVAAQYKASVKTSGLVGRADTQWPQPVIVKAFTLNKPSSKAAETFGGVQLADGDYAVIALREVRPGEGKADDGPLGAESSINYGLRERDAVYQALEAAAKIDINRRNL